MEKVFIILVNLGLRSPLLHLTSNCVGAYVDYCYIVLPYICFVITVLLLLYCYIVTKLFCYHCESAVIVYCYIVAFQFFCIFSLRYVVNLRKMAFAI